jgi:hypothetical protein
MIATSPRFGQTWTNIPVSSVVQDCLRIDLLRIFSMATLQNRTGDAWLFRFVLLQCGLRLHVALHRRSAIPVHGRGKVARPSILDAGG